MPVEISQRVTAQWATEARASLSGAEEKGNKSWECEVGDGRWATGGQRTDFWWHWFSEHPPFGARGLGGVT